MKNKPKKHRNDIWFHSKNEKKQSIILFLFQFDFVYSIAFSLSASAQSQDVGTKARSGGDRSDYIFVFVARCPANKNDSRHVYESILPSHQILHTIEAICRCIHHDHIMNYDMDKVSERRLIYSRRCCLFNHFASLAFWLERTGEPSRRGNAPIQLNVTLSGNLGVYSIGEYHLAFQREGWLGKLRQWKPRFGEIDAGAAYRSLLYALRSLCSHRPPLEPRIPRSRTINFTSEASLGFLDFLVSLDVFNSFIYTFSFDRLENGNFYSLVDSAIKWLICGRTLFSGFTNRAVSSVVSRKKNWILLCLLPCFPNHIKFTKSIQFVASFSRS